MRASVRSLSNSRDADALNAEDAIVEREVDAAHEGVLVAPVHPAVGRQLAQQLRRELERLVGEDVVLQELERLALLGGRDRHERVAAVRRRPCDRGGRARRRRTARPGTPPLPYCRSSMPNASARPLIAFALVDDAFGQALQQLLGQQHAVLGELHRVGAQVPPVDERVGRANRSSSVP